MTYDKTREPQAYCSKYLYKMYDIGRFLYSLLHVLVDQSTPGWRFCRAIATATSALAAQYLKTGQGAGYRLCPNLDVPPQGPEQAPNFRDLWCGVLWRSSANNKPKANSTYTSSTTLLLRFEIGGAIVVVK